MAEVADSVSIVPSKGDADGSKFKAYETMYNYSIHNPEEVRARLPDSNFGDGAAAAAAAAPAPSPPSVAAMAAVALRLRLRLRLLLSHSSQFFRPQSANSRARRLLQFLLSTLRYVVVVALPATAVLATRNQTNPTKSVLGEGSYRAPVLDPPFRQCQVRHFAGRQHGMVHWRPAERLLPVL